MDCQSCQIERITEASSLEKKDSTILTIETDVKKEGSIMLDLRKSYKRTKRNDGSHDGHEAIKVAIVFKMGSERGTLVVEALHGAKVVGTAKIDYARTHARHIVSQSAGLLDG